MITAAVYLTALHLNLDPSNWVYVLPVLFDLVVIALLAESGRDES